MFNSMKIVLLIFYVLSKEYNSILSVRCNFAFGENLVALVKNIRLEILFRNEIQVVNRKCAKGARLARPRCSCLAPHPNP